MRRIMMVLALAALGAAGYFWVMRGAESACRAERAALVAVMPGAIDRLAVKYPLRVGLLRQTLDRDGAVQRDILRELAALPEDKDAPSSELSCFFRAAQMRVFPSAAEERVAEELERRFGL